MSANSTSACPRLDRKREDRAIGRTRFLDRTRLGRPSEAIEMAIPMPLIGLSPVGLNQRGWRCFPWSAAAQDGGSSSRSPESED